MDGTQSKKTDRRSLYSQAVIKNALLKLLGEKDHRDITVSDLCRAAEINRGTFYLHYGNIGQVLDALFDDALGSLHGVLEQVGIPAAGEDKCAYPLCHFLRENKKYRALFFSDSLHSQVIRRLTQAGEDGFVRRLQASSQASPEILRTLFFFQINGCLAVCKNGLSRSDEQWSKIQCSLDGFLKRGFDGL